VLVAWYLGSTPFQEGSAKWESWRRCAPAGIRYATGNFAHRLNAMVARLHMHVWHEAESWREVAVAADMGMFNQSYKRDHFKDDVLASHISRNPAPAGCCSS